jgi:hypothetical protein
MIELWVLLKEPTCYVSTMDTYLKELSPITDPLSPSLLSGMCFQRKKFIKVEVIGSALPITLPRQERSISNCMKEVVLKM